MHNQNTHIGPSFSLRNRIGRVLWDLIYVVFFKFSPKPLHGWRRFWLRLFGAKVGKGVHVYPKVAIWAPWNLELKDYCGIGNRTILYSQGKISIGYKVVISQGSHICAGTHDYTKKGFPLVAMPIVIHDYVWIAAEVFVHPGVEISEGAVIGARSVVVHTMPPWMVCSGFPCKPIKERMGKEEIENFKNETL